jgi:hypothetical protein
LALGILCAFDLRFGLHYERTAWNINSFLSSCSVQSKGPVFSLLDPEDTCWTFSFPPTIVRVPKS